MKKNISLFKKWDLGSKKTPYFYFDKSIFIRNIKKYSKREFQLYYSTKSCLFDVLVKQTSKDLDGFTVSSIDYLKRVRSETDKPIHFISPCIRDQEINVINVLANSVTFNSIEQCKRYKHKLGSQIKSFIRINPELSFVKNKRINPSRPFSHLGVPISQFKKYFKFDGIHFHNNHQSKNFKDIIKTMKHIEAYLKNKIGHFEYVNLGGGYIWSKELIQAINREQNRWHKELGIQLIIEPGFDISNSAGFLVSSVIDLFKRGSKYIAILDTSVNHLPNIFSYQINPEVVNHHIVHPYPYILAGASCLAGDVFGEYCFKDELSLGDLIIFKNVGAYSLVKAHRFNGIEIPKVYMA